MPVKHESPAKSSSMSDLKSHVIFLYNLVKSGRLPGRAFVVDLAPKDLMVVAHIGRVSSVMFTHSMWVVFSLFR